MQLASASCARGSRTSTHVGERAARAFDGGGWTRLRRYAQRLGNWLRHAYVRMGQAEAAQRFCDATRQQAPVPREILNRLEQSNPRALGRLLLTNQLRKLGFIAGIAEVEVIYCKVDRNQIGVRNNRILVSLFEQAQALHVAA